jgi:fumarate reductase subunit D
MTPLLGQLVALCLLRKGPQDLPYSLTLTRHLVLFSLGCGLLYVVVLDIPSGALRVALGMLIALAVPWALLGWRQRRERYAQTLAALVGTGALFKLVFLPVALWAKQHVPAEGVQELTSEQLAAGWVVLGLLGWKLAVSGHILRHALDLPKSAGMALALGWFLIEFNIDRLLFGVGE